MQGVGKNRRKEDVPDIGEKLTYTLAENQSEGGSIKTIINVHGEVKVNSHWMCHYCSFPGQKAGTTRILFSSLKSSTWEGGILQLTTLVENLFLVHFQLSSLPRSLIIPY